MPNSTSSPTTHDRQEPTLNHTSCTPIRAMTSLEKERSKQLRFVKQSNSFWQKSGIKLCGALLILILLACLALQIYYFRNSLMAAMPAIRPALVSMMAPFKRSVDYPISLNANKDIAIEASSFNRLPDGNYMLEVVLRNNTGNTLKAPHLELTLQSISGDTVARRIFSPAELSTPIPYMTPHGELLVQQGIRVNIQGSVGYHLNLLYL